MSDPIVRYYNPDHNPDGLSLPGVPLADIPESRWETLPTWLQNSVDAMRVDGQQVYYKSKPKPERGGPKYTTTRRTSADTTESTEAARVDTPPADSVMTEEAAHD